MTAPARRADDSRRRAVLESALETFARAGYRGASMDAIARAARISRPGLYFLFESKEALFREAVSHVLSADLDVITEILADDTRPVRDRLVAAFDRWAGRYIGPMVRDVPTVIADNPDLLDDVARAAPARFADLLTAALTGETPNGAVIAQTLNSVSVGLIHQVATREEYLERLRLAVELLA
ncbi:TetR/AcrR family transcriptional regulator [Curtobacterium sp. VKM Ac-2887]|uniref:TetR/AcrR family transcriptional regulator n=1 Tax=Curtobacterium sp. VKM Ac-2887 TaxID=2783819 RepID=UPI00188AC839|nr:TetR/AcrR family transcriptional regulator [Curtobacterium sp. VKM Ac-2887]MBF4588303.1 TetR/AcrR family transcriptional regulator [Curtobacterium sp. VKM Ac-2887]